MDITEELEEAVDLSTEYNNKTVNFTVAKANLTPAFIQNIGNIADYPTALSGCLRKWDVTAHGEPWPLDAENLSRLPSTFLAKIIDRIGETWGGEEAKKKPSASGSVAAAK